MLNATAPLFGALMAGLQLGDRIGRLRRVRLALGFLGRSIVTGTLLSTGLVRTRSPAGVAPERP